MPKTATALTQERQPLSDDESDQVDAPVVTQSAPKVKKERTPKQKEAFANAMAILKAKRESVKTVEKERFEKADAVEKDRLAKEKFEKAKNHKKKLPPVPSYVTTGDLERFKVDLMTAMKPSAPTPVIEKPAPPPAPAPVAVAAKPVVAQSLTGHNLLDKLFFS